MQHILLKLRNSFGESSYFVTSSEKLWEIFNGRCEDEDNLLLF